MLMNGYCKQHSVVYGTYLIVINERVSVGNVIADSKVIQANIVIGS